MSTTLSDFTPADQIFIAPETLKHAAALQNKAAELQEQIATIRDRLNDLIKPLQDAAQDEISPLENEIVMLLEARDRIIRDHQSRGVESDGPFSIVVDKKPRQEMDDAAFREKYPDQHRAVFDQVGYKKYKASKEDAALELTSHQIEKVCKLRGNYTYKID